MSPYSDISVEALASGTQLIRLNRPGVRNALRTSMLGEIAAALEAAEQDESLRCVLLTGSEQAFAAGADVREMAELDAVGLFKDQRPEHWRRIRRFRKPLLAAVNGYCLGGGFELALHADIIIAGDDARFGQPEINLGIIPGAGGTQRLVRCAGKALAMKMVLSGETITAREALAAGIVAEVTQPETALERSMELAQVIADKPPLALRLAKECVLQAFEAPLEQGLELERRAFLFLAATEDRREGIEAFLAKRPPRFEGR